MIFWPLALTFTWKLVKVANCEIIRGEVSITRGAAGGLSYVSIGTSRGTLCVGASWPEASGTKNSDSRPVKTLALNIVKNIMTSNSPCVNGSRYRNRGRRSRQKGSSRGKAHGLTHKLFSTGPNNFVIFGFP